MPKIQVFPARTCLWAHSSLTGPVKEDDVRRSMVTMLWTLLRLLTNCLESMDSVSNVAIPCASQSDVQQTRNSHVWSLDNTHGSTETHFQSRFPVNIWCGVTGSQIIGPFVLEERLTSERYFRFLEDELPVMLHVALHIRRELWL
jgi:hypothetical protein